MKLLRIEGVNLSHSVGDTEDLSTRRGGSLMLLDAIERIANENQQIIRRISSGASAGLFELVGEEKAARDAIGLLLKEEPYRYGTFMVEVIDSKKDFPAAERDIVSANRWSQMQSLSFSPRGLDGGINKVCKMDEVRPAIEEIRLKKLSENNKPQPIGAAVKARRKYGVKAKKSFYDRILGREVGLEFTGDFEEIATKPGFELSPKTLDGKLAVFYADGNDFGKLARSCEKPNELRNWDDYIKTQRKELLNGLLEHARQTIHWLNGDNTLRLETLLWGGDELMFAVPGWCGMELAQKFFELTSAMRYPNNEEGTVLKHACGLVFCHHQAPISRISRIAKLLAEEGKRVDRTANSLNWMTLESFDHAGSGLNEYLKSQFGDAINWSDLTLNEDTLAALNLQFPKLRESLPRSAIVRITRTLAEGRALDAKGEEKPLVRRAHMQVSEAGGEDFKALWKILHPRSVSWDEKLSPDDLGAWLKLVQLWDYCPLWHDPAAAQGDAK